MTDWDHLLKSAAKGGSFVGTTSADEDAYYRAFADEPLPLLPSLRFRDIRNAMLDRIRTFRLA